MPTLTNFDERTNVRMSAEMMERLRTVARHREVSLGSLIREAIRRLLADAEPELTPRTHKRNDP
jgi:predicted DNA-binding protein